MLLAALLWMLFLLFCVIAGPLFVFMLCVAILKAVFCNTSEKTSG